MIDEEKKNNQSEADRVANQDTDSLVDAVIEKHREDLEYLKNK